MSGQIRMSPEQMRQRAGEVHAQGDTFDGVINKMQNIINVLQTEWEGQTSRAFAEQFDSLRPSFEQMRQLIYDISTQLRDIATR